MAPAYKLTYFDFHGRAEPIRYLLLYGGIEFEDIRLDNAQWVAVKPTTPYGQIPILEYNGKVVHQSIAIGRYVAKLIKLYGKNDWEDLEVDATVDNIRDLILKANQYTHEMDEKVKEKVKETLFKESIPFYLKRLDDQIKNNNGYFVGGKLTWADIYFAGSIEYLNGKFGEDVIAKWPNLRAVGEKVLTLPKIKAFLTQRKPFSFKPFFK